jgi:hypothetical protein
MVLKQEEMPPQRRVEQLLQIEPISALGAAVARQAAKVVLAEGAGDVLLDACWW